MIPALGRPGDEELVDFLDAVEDAANGHADAWEYAVDFADATMWVWSFDLP